MYFRYHELRKTWLGKCLKILVSEDLLTSNMLNDVKHCLILHSRTFNTSVDKYE